MKVTVDITDEVGKSILKKSEADAND